MATGAAGDGIFRGIFEGSISGHDLEFSKRPYHRNCGCALHKSRGNCSHSSRYMTISYPIRRSWSEGCLSLVAAASPAASGHSSGCSSPAVADIGKRNLLPVNEDGEDLVFTHVACLRIATPVDQLPRIDEQLTESQNFVAKYYVVGQSQRPMEELDQFMAHYILLLSSFKEQLQQQCRVHAMEAVMACWDLDQSLQNLTGVASGEGTGATMSDDDEDQVESETNCNYNGILESNGFGPLVLTENERFLMERVRQELKQELKQGYREKIVDIREEILRKRRAGKLPGDTTSALKAWWNSHSKWPYPTEEDKAKLVQETGLQLKQVNNWFINQRKRSWSSTPSSSTQKSKRKSAGEKSRNDHFT